MLPEVKRISPDVPRGPRARQSTDVEAARGHTCVHTPGPARAAADPHWHWQPRAGRCAAQQVRESRFRLGPGRAPFRALSGELPLFVAPVPASRGDAEA